MPASRRPPHFALPNEPLYCPHGHELGDAWPAGDNPMLTQRCDYRPPPGNAGTCNACVYWILLPGGVRIAVEVSSAEAHEMERRRMNIEQVLAFLGLRWPRAAA
jgi:hypothetical protein